MKGITNSRKVKIYMAVSADKYEFPLGLFENIKQLAIWAGTSYDYARNVICHKRVFKNLNCRFIKVVIEEDQEEGVNEK